MPPIIPLVLLLAPLQCAPAIVKLPKSVAVPPEKIVIKSITFEEEPSYPPAKHALVLFPTAAVPDCNRAVDKFPKSLAVPELFISSWSI